MVGLRQPSLYSYFDFKNVLYDAIFADGNRQLLAHLDSVELRDDPRAALKSFLAAFAASPSRTRHGICCSPVG
ncbi:MAG: hypothetical protein H0V67_07530 [Geodermatophilaceae bacterium]|nr:hypothetical protein [Geodermatophilaceae bacterium]